MSLVLLFAAGVALVSLGLVAYGLARVVQSLRTRTWRPVAAVIADRRVVEEPVFVEQFLPTYFPSVRFRYQTPSGPKESCAMSVAPKDWRSFSRLAAEQELMPYPVGAEVIAYVCPQNPDMAVLRRGVSRQTMSHYLAVMIGGALTLSAVVVTLVLLRPLD